MNRQLETGFVRNRRFLLAASVGLACMNVLKLDFTQINILGNVATIKDPSKVYLIAWIIWGWALAQYIVWFIDVGASRSFWLAVRLHAKESLGRLKVHTTEVPKRIVDNHMSNLTTQVGKYSVRLKDVRFMRKVVPVPNEDDQTVNLVVQSSVCVPE
jgi:hypothetical protein